MKIACRVAGLMLTTEAMIAELPEEKGEAAACPAAWAAWAWECNPLQLPPYKGGGPLQAVGVVLNERDAFEDQKGLVTRRGLFLAKVSR